MANEKKITKEELEKKIAEKEKAAKDKKTINK